MQLSITVRLQQAQSSLRRMSPLAPQEQISSRRLLDYTQCRSDGTKSKRANLNKTDNSDNTPRYPSHARKARLPNFQALDSSLSQIERLDNEHQEDDEVRIEFFLKVMHKSQRKQSRRISTLDTVGGRKNVMERIVSSRKSMMEIRSKSPSRSDPVVSERRRKSTVN